MPQPSDPLLYQMVKGYITRKIPKHSAVRSAQIVRMYKTAFKELYGESTKPYRGKKGSGLNRWFQRRA